jgi:transcriptional regulator with XRE-family HTH domain
MTERINKLLKYSKMSASQFADKVGVQRSSISHVLSGRNKPSLDFVTKILESFSEINPDWLLRGEGNMLNEENDDLFSKNTISESEKVEKADYDRENLERKFTEIPKIVEKKEKAGRRKGQSGSKSIERIVIFYDDGTFSDHSPDS